MGYCAMLVVVEIISFVAFLNTKNGNSPGLFPFGTVTST